MDESNTLKKALIAIRKLKQSLAEYQRNSFQPIAITGIGCRFPNVMNAMDYWQLLSSGTNVISDIPEERWKLLQNTTEIQLKTEASHCKGGYLSDISGFDAYFFGISPREAMLMDPQQRLLLEVAYESLEDAGLSAQSLAGSKTGVFTSLYPSQYLQLQSQVSDLDSLYLPTGNAVSIAANRLSYLLDLRGPSITLDTACSSSLVAVHLACMSLINKSCDQAIVCAVNINLLPSINLLLSKAKMLAPDGQCKTFDAAANGYVQGEGVGAIILKPLTKALHDHDKIYAVIAGTDVNQDGKSNGLTAPNGQQQESLLRSVYKIANIDPKVVSYIECHGTGTFLGDPIEAQALGEIIGKGRNNHQPCWLGSVKTNIGHLEPAAGIASIIKVALALKNKAIPAHLNFMTPNPHIPFDRYHFSIPTKLTEFPKYGEYRVAGISGFGFGGTNAHVVMRELSDQEQVNHLYSHVQQQQEQIFTLSAATVTSLKAMITSYADYLQSNQALDLGKLCYNLHLRRTHHYYRLAIVTNSIHELTGIFVNLKNSGFDWPRESDKVYINITNNKIITTKNNHKNNLYDLAIAYINRTAIDWRMHHKDTSYDTMDLPLYPWEHIEYWANNGNNRLNLQNQEIIQYPFYYKKIASPLDILQFEFKFDTTVMPEIKDSFNFLHAGYYMEMLARAAGQLHNQGTFTVRQCNFISPIYVPNNANITVQLIIEKKKAKLYSFAVYTFSNKDDWVRHADGQLSLVVEEPQDVLLIDSIVNRCPIIGTDDGFFERVKSMNMPCGDSIRWTKQYWMNDKEILCEFQQPQSAKNYQAFQLAIHPGIVDGCVQALFMLLPDHLIKPYIASHIDSIRFYGMKDSSLYLYAKLNTVTAAGDKYVADFYLLNSDGEIIIKCENLSMTQLNVNIKTDEVINSGQVALDLSSLPLSERQSIILDYLIEQCAILFSMPRKDINPNLSLRDLGIDSLMSIVLSAKIESQLKIVYSMQDILKGPSINEMVDFMLGLFQKPVIAAGDSSKKTYITPKNKRDHATSRLYCFPYGGSGSSTYQNWHTAFPADVEVCAIQLPGREERINELPIDNINTLLAEIIDHIQDDLTIPFALFGHSFGALIAFELARTLRKHNLPQPYHLIASAFPDPRIRMKSLNILISELSKVDIPLFELTTPAAVSQLGNGKLMRLADIFYANGIVEYKNQRISADILKLLLPIFISDMKIVKSYEYYEDSALDFPITVFSGIKDTWVAYEDHLGWAGHTKHTCEIHQFNGGHLFIKEPAIKDDMLRKLTQSIICSR